jgi:DNA-binding XRE family transcriptional regulator
MAGFVGNRTLFLVSGDKDAILGMIVRAKSPFAVEGSLYTNAQRRADPEVQELRKAAGGWLRGLRERRGLSQRELASMVGAEYYTFISQLETGRGRVPPDRYGNWAQALEVEPREFVKTLLAYYDPITYRFLFGDEERAAGPS